MPLRTEKRRDSGIRPSAIGAIGALALVALVATTLFLSRQPAPGPDLETELAPLEGGDGSGPSPRPLDALAGGNPAATAAEAAPSSSAALERPVTKFMFKVAVSPLVLATTDPKARGEFQSIHAAFLAELRSIPSLELVELAARNAHAPDDVDFDVTAKGESRNGPGPLSLFRVYWSARRGGAGDWSASIDSSIPWTPDTIARAAAEELRRFPFPPDVSRPVELEAAVLDTNRSNDDRFAALAELKTIPQRFAFVGRDERRIVSVAAADIVANSTDPDIRSRVWRAMRKQDDPYLIGPLVDSVLNDDSEAVRLEAVRTLGNNFGHDAKAVAGLEYALVHDLSPDVRTNARWESLDEASRRGYVAGTLLRDDLTDAERLELLKADVSGFRGYIDRQAVQALVDIAARARPSTDEATAEAGPGRVNAAELVPLLTELLTDDDSEEIRGAAATALLRHRDEAGVRETLELVQCDDPSPKVRSQIARALRRYTVNCERTGGAGATSDRRVGGAQ